jgi:hypothetical protein
MNPEARKFRKQGSVCRAGRPCYARKARLTRDRFCRMTGPAAHDRVGDAAIAAGPCAWRRAGRSGLTAPRAWAPALARLVLSEVSSPDGAGAAAALVLATQEFVANGRGRPSDRRRRSAAWPGRTGSRGRVGRRGCWRSKRAVIVGAVLVAAFVDRLSGLLARTQQVRRRAGCR